MKKIVILAIFAFTLFASELELKSGYVAAHTQMVMDSTIDPTNNSLQASLTIQNGDITTIKGKFWVEMSLFSSDNIDRDKNMYKEIEIDKFKMATYVISSIEKIDDKDNYTINGALNFHGISKNISTKAKIKIQNSELVLEANSMILMSDFGIKAPCMVFMCVRDQVDLLIKATFLNK